MRREPLAQHLAARVVAKQSEVRVAVDLGERLAERDQGSIVVGRDAQGVGERGKMSAETLTVGSAVGAAREVA